MQLTFLEIALGIAVGLRFAATTGGIGAHGIPAQTSDRILAFILGCALGGAIGALIPTLFHSITEIRVTAY